MTTKLERIGTGGNGPVYYNKDKGTVYKYIRVDREFGGDLNSPFRHEHAEGHIQYLVGEECADATPHILPVESFTHIDGDTSSAKQVGVLITPVAPHGSLETYAIDGDTEYLRLYFQIVWTLYAMQTAFPGFHHNDLNAGNLLVTDTLDTRRYTAPIPGVSYTLPPGRSIWVADFEMANVPGVYENYKTLDFQMSNPCFSLGASGDLYRVTVCMLGKCRKRISKMLLRHINSVFANTLSLASRDNYYYPTARIRAAIGHVTPRYLLFNTLLFHQFRDDAAAAAAAAIGCREFTVLYASPMNNHYCMPDGYNEQLVVPLFVNSMYTPTWRYFTRLDRCYETETETKANSKYRESSVTANELFGTISAVVQLLVCRTTRAHQLQITQRACDLFVAFLTHPQSLAEQYPAVHPLLHVCAVATATADVVATKTPCIFTSSDICSIYHNGKFTANQMLQVMLQWNWLQSR